MVLSSGVFPGAGYLLINRPVNCALNVSRLKTSVALLGRDS